jgi:hypothetical protein
MVLLKFAVFVGIDNVQVVLSPRIVLEPQVEVESIVIMELLYYIVK